MTNLVEKVAIQQVLTRAGMQGTYYAVTYDGDTNEPNDVDADTATPVTPQSVGANELSGSFDVDQNYGRRRERVRVSWLWSLEIAFQQEVTQWAAEEEWLKNPPTVDVDATNGITRQAILDLVGVSCQHPPRQNPQSGSRLEFTFDVRLTKR